MMDFIIANKPTEYYAYRLFKCTDEEINIYCKSVMDFVSKAKYLKMMMEYHGYIFEDYQIKKDLKTKKGDIIHNVILFQGKMSDVTKKLKKKLDRNKEVKQIKSLSYREDGKMIYLPKEVLFKLNSFAVEPKEDYAKIIMRKICQTSN